MELRQRRTASEKVQEAKKAPAAPPPPPTRKRKAPTKRQPPPPRKVSRSKSRDRPTASTPPNFGVEKEVVVSSDRQTPQTWADQLDDDAKQLERDIVELRRQRDRSSSAEGQIPVQTPVVRFEGDLPRQRPLPSSVERTKALVDYTSTGRPSILRSSSVPGPSQRPHQSQSKKGKERALTSSPPTLPGPSPSTDDTSLPDIQAILQIKINKNIISTKRYPIWSTDFHYIDIGDEIATVQNKYREDRRREGKKLKIASITDPIAVISATGLKQPIYSSFRTDEDRAVIRKDILRLYRMNKNREIQVVITAEASFIVVSEQTPKPQYHRPEAQVILDDSDEGDIEHTSAVRGRSQSKPLPPDTRRHLKETATQRMRRQQDVEQVIAGATNNFVLDITTRYQCKDRTCVNHGHTCYPGKETGHLALTAVDLMMWNEAIQAKRCSVETPPGQMIISILT